MDFGDYVVRPSTGTMRVEVTCKRCKCLLRHDRLNGLSTLDDIVAAAFAHDESCGFGVGRFGDARLREAVAECRKSR